MVVNVALNQMVIIRYREVNVEILLTLVRIGREEVELRVSRAHHVEMYRVPKAGEDPHLRLSDSDSVVVNEHQFIAASCHGLSVHFFVESRAGDQISMDIRLPTCMDFVVWDNGSVVQTTGR